MNEFSAASLELIVSKLKEEIYAPDQIIID